MTEHTNNLNDLIVVLLYACRHQVSIKKKCTALHSSHALQSLLQLPKPKPYQAPLSSFVKLHISKQERDSQKNF